MHHIIIQYNIKIFEQMISYTGTLDDDFVLQANGGVPVDIKETEIKRYLG